MLMFDVYYFGTGNGDVRPRLYPNPILALLPAIFTMRYTLHHAHNEQCPKEPLDLIHIVVYGCHHLICLGLALGGE